MTKDDAEEIFIIVDRMVGAASHHQDGLVDVQKAILAQKLNSLVKHENQTKE